LVGCPHEVAVGGILAGPGLRGDDPLLRRRLTERDIKKKIVGHWGTVPGQNFIYTHLNRVINEYLDGITLQDLLDQQRAHYANDYMI